MWIAARFLVVLVLVADHVLRNIPTSVLAHVEALNSNVVTSNGNNGSAAGPSVMPDSQGVQSSSGNTDGRLQSSVPSGGSPQFNLYSYGALGNGRSDDTLAFQKAWEEACSIPGAVIVVPKGGVFVVGPLLFLGPCEPNIALQLDGELLAVSSIAASRWETAKNNYWLQFKGLNGLTIQGEGTIDGNGATWWVKPCKEADFGSIRCKAPTALKIVRSTNVVVSGITIQNAAQEHLRFTSCSQVLVTGVTVHSPANTVNTDGFDFDNTTHATLQYSSAATGDDCVGIQTGSSEILIQGFKCGPGHGISIGSLGESGAVGCVSNVRVRDVTAENAQGAVRIKTWQGGSGLVSGISFEDITVENVIHPIVIDQYYCDASQCANSTNLALAISDISFINIKGTYDSTRGKAVQLACSDVVPCTGISMINVNLWPTGGSELRNNASFAGGSFCWEAFGSSDGFSSTIGLKTCVQPQPSNIDWISALTQSQQLCSQRQPDSVVK